MSLSWYVLHSCDKLLGSEDSGEIKTKLFVPRSLHAAFTSTDIRKLSRNAWACILMDTQVTRVTNSSCSQRDTILADV